MFLAQGILLALYDRNQTGEGQWVYVFAGIHDIHADQASRWIQAGEFTEQAGNDHPTRMPQGCYETADGRINVSASGGMFKRLCDAVEAPALFADPDFRLTHFVPRTANASTKRLAKSWPPNRRHTG